MHFASLISNNNSNTPVRWPVKQNFFKGKTSGKAVHQSETVRFEKNIFVSLTCNISWFLNDRNICFLLSKIKIWWSSAMIKISFLRIGYPQLRPPQKNSDFDGFSLFLEKLEIFLWTIFWKLIVHDLKNFSSTFKGGHL